MGSRQHSIAADLLAGIPAVAKCDPRKRPASIRDKSDAGAKPDAWLPRVNWHAGVHGGHAPTTTFTSP